MSNQRACRNELSDRLFRSHLSAVNLPLFEIAERIDAVSLRW